jgi:hypothetical protein
MPLNITVALSLMLVSSGLAWAPQATVHIYRYRLSVGQAARPTVACDDFPVARILNGRVYTMQVSAGRHAFTIDAKPIGLTVDIEPGKDYFVRLDYPPNVLTRTDPAPVLVAPEQGSMEIQKLQPLDKRYIESATCGRP